MAHLLGGEALCLRYPTQVVFDGVTVGVNDGDRIGIVGRNGEGKSSLVGMLTGQIMPDSGRVTRRGGVQVAALEQADTLDPAQSVGWALVGDRADHEWAGDARVRDVVAGLVSDIDWAAPAGTLSGGQRRRVQLAQLLIGDWDVIALDEPTNHLDVEGITWLAAHLTQRWPRGSGGLLLVTHDRWFLDEVATSTWEVHGGPQGGVIEPFDGGYAAYVLQRVERDRIAAVAEAKRQNLMRKELAWLRRGAPARTSKPKFRIEAANQLIEDVPPIRNTVELAKLATARLGKDVIDLIDVSVSFPESLRSRPPASFPESLRSRPPASFPESLRSRPPASFPESLPSCPPASFPKLLGSCPPASSDRKSVLRGVEWRIAPGERTGIVGANGAGKSTLLGVIAGTITPDSGQVKRGKTVRLAMLDQQGSQLEGLEDDLVREVIGRLKAGYMVDGKELTPAQLLERLGFRRDQLSARVRDLSGGQRRRLQLMLILLAEPNVLILDEPTNDVDIDMLSATEDLLDSWPGTLIVVSHDRYLLERVTDQQYAVLDGHLRHLPGGIEEYLRIAAHRHAGPATARSSPAAAATESLSGAQLRGVQKEIGALDRALAKLADRINAKHVEIAEHDQSDHMGIVRLTAELRELEDDMAGKENRWLELSEMVESG